MPTLGNWNKRDTAAVAGEKVVYCGNIKFTVTKDQFAKVLSDKGFDNCIVYWPPPKNASHPHEGWCHVQFPDRDTAARARAELSGAHIGARSIKTGPVCPPNAGPKSAHKPPPTPAHKPAPKPMDPSPVDKAIQAMKSLSTQTAQGAVFPSAKDSSSLAALTDDALPHSSAAPSSPVAPPNDKKADTPAASGSPLSRDTLASSPAGNSPISQAAKDALASLATAWYPKEWEHDSMEPDSAVSSFKDYMREVEEPYEAAGIMARPIISNGLTFLYSHPVPSPAEQNNQFCRPWTYVVKGSRPHKTYKIIPLESVSHGCQKDDRRPPQWQDVLNHDAPYKDTAHLFASSLKMQKLGSGVDLQPGQLLGRDPETRSPVSQSTTFVKPSELSASASSATCRTHMMKYLTPPIVGSGWGHHSRFRQWQLHGRAIKPDMVPNKTWDTTSGSPFELIMDGDRPGAAKKITFDEVDPVKWGIIRDEAPRSIAVAMSRKTTAAEKRPKPRKETPQDKINKQVGGSRDW
ncbi:hypothetical protein FMEXI_10624 [Fusarium mexicanum]|uniref:RRM domain-containing protein n=1 Tax=Fusarium mexicanum TaxID=751941 RepID=A0A8H5IFF1_9HYPO|nr:hypothetical protein FMEXI_10624 [Fusarium mexicanum]